jgi:hypothetical protein
MSMVTGGRNHATVRNNEFNLLTSLKRGSVDILPRLTAGDSSYAPREASS